MFIIGVGITFALTMLIGIPYFLWVGSRGYHQKRHTYYSELMCDHCHKRNNTVPLGEALERWPMRIMGGVPPKGTG